ncbi:MAG: hypothetical protein A3D65_05310 [Candidatus Lloydbacteria bacterium RIFCSPHIGHO2_02_FULL_50_13]|uniref:Uncharacterized protein n=1 Tax=Candidatus Lloydbacteria bacterium RIFCSPHIGHO2_02_FULL_50_13 TaxID=1798661 RepID=A0A1G2D7X1_9BACT|nr:MAG: hypothetical protein A3D65_05310 [Candidatus Lloydbacteria bacterium RIFCSPHIGHO2_02_FULL_50_13]
MVDHLGVAFVSLFATFAVLWVLRAVVFLPLLVGTGLTLYSHSFSPIFWSIGFTYLFGYGATYWEFVREVEGYEKILQTIKHLETARSD